MDLTAADIRFVLMGLIVLLVSVAVHEFGHAYMAHKLGDDTPQRQGRVTLNPLAHADPIGTFLLPLVGSLHAAAGGMGGGFGWGKPVQWQPHRIRRGIKMTTANILVSIAGPFMNISLAAVTAVVHVLLTVNGVIAPDSQLHQVLVFIVKTNFFLMFFNLLPIPPLDGGHVAEALVPHKYRRQFDEVAKYGPIVIIGIMLIPQIRQVFVVPGTWCTEHLYKAFVAVFA